MASAVDTVVQTVLASQQITATPQQRAAAVQLFEQVKHAGSRAVHEGMSGAQLAVVGNGLVLGMARLIKHFCRGLGGRLLTVSDAAQLKAGELHSSTSIGAELIKAHQPVEVQVMGYTLLQHLVSGRLSSHYEPRGADPLPARGLAVPARASGQAYAVPHWAPA